MIINNSIIIIIIIIIVFLIIIIIIIIYYISYISIINMHTLGTQVCDLVFAARFADKRRDLRTK